MKDELPDCKIEKESLEISKEQGWQRELDSFAQLYVIQDPIRRQYELTRHDQSYLFVRHIVRCRVPTQQLCEVFLSWAIQRT